ncbi:MFS transporter [Lolliginicoccus levis]|uniref:MFS transporter n=1 Tax=Lolliginicoccus levis TaxID=2919542 RepID=UPI00241E9D35|nr:MFS transporter [Lolliginicoccus levis]
MTGRIRAFAEAVRSRPPLLRLAVTRWLNQFGDGFFQAALGGAILFNPERNTDPRAIAAGFVLLLLPYSLIGPFVGVLLDRWDRRWVLVWAMIVRMVLTVAAGYVLLASIPGPALILIALAAIGTSRFMFAGMSAALPNTIPSTMLVPVNSILVTVGAALAALGATVSIAIATWAGAGDTGSGTTVLFAVAPLALGVFLAWGFPPRLLGPHGGRTGERWHQPGFLREARAVASGLATSGRAAWRSKGVTAALLALAAHRAVFGINTLIMVLVLRSPDPGSMLPGGLAGFGLAVAVTAGGMLVGAVLAPLIVPWLGRTRTIVGAVLLAAVTQVMIVSMLGHDALVIAAFLLGIAGQMIKLSGDAAMQIEIADRERGSVFALQDMLFNVLFVGAMAAASIGIAADGRSLSIVLVGAGAYVLAIALIALNEARAAPPRSAAERSLNLFRHWVRRLPFR